MPDNLSHRVVDQRVRNRIIESVEILSLGDMGVREVGPTEFFEGFYDQIPHRDDGDMPQNSAISLKEKEALKMLSKVLDDACDSTPNLVQIEDFISTGWPERIKFVASSAYKIMICRGRFSEDFEELEPSSK